MIYTLTSYVGCFLSVYFFKWEILAHFCFSAAFCADESLWYFSILNQIGLSLTKKIKQSIFLWQCQMKEKFQKNRVDLSICPHQILWDIEVQRKNVTIIQKTLILSESFLSLSAVEYRIQTCCYNLIEYLLIVLMAWQPECMRGCVVQSIKSVLLFAHAQRIKLIVDSFSNVQYAKSE